MSSIRSFVPLQKLGQGTYSSVYKVRRIDDGQVYALKKVKLSSLTLKEKQNSLNQVRILASIESPYIVAYKQAFFDQSLNVLCIVMQYAGNIMFYLLDSGDLQNFIKSAVTQSKPIPQSEIWSAAEHIIKALSVLHEKGIMHRDLKCANIFKHGEIYKLGDLNVSKVNHDKNKLCYTQTGTPYYASPQVWRDEPYDLKSDIWSFGCVIYEMCALKPPFNGKDMQELFKNVQKARFPKWSSFYSPQLWEFVNLCLQKEPQKRPTANQLLNFIKKYHSVTSGVKIIDKKQDNLLKTIKVPTDLKKLNQALPQSKYRKQKISLINDQNLKIPKDKIKTIQSSVTEKLNQKQKATKIYAKSPPASLSMKQPVSPFYNSQKRQYQNQQQDFIVQKPLVDKDKFSILEIIPGKNKSLVYLPSNKNESKDQQLKQKSPPASLLNLNYNHSQIPQSSYKSPTNKNESTKLFKSPKSEMRLGKKVQSSNLGYSQRQQQSDRKPSGSTASKVEKIRSQLLNEVNDLLKKPSMPRTQKTIINSSHLFEPNIVQQISSSHIGKNRKNQVIQQKNIDKNYSYVAQSGKDYRSKEQQKINKMVGGYMMGQKSHVMVQGLRQRLVKKNRILSSGLMMKPSWWG